MKTVLVIDDEAMIRDYFTAVLQPLGINVLTADDGDTAIEVMKKNPEIELIILDLTMKRMSGWDAYPRLKNIKNEVKVIVASGYIDDDAEKKLKDMGVDIIFRKPFSPLNFKTTVMNLLGL